MKKFTLIVALFTSICISCADKTEGNGIDSMPKDFVYMAEVIPDVIQEIRYNSIYNFVGARIDDIPTHTSISRLTK